MSLNLILPWFPIVLSAAVGARLVGRKRAVWLGVTCALYWIVVVQMTAKLPFWSRADLLAPLLAGSAAIVGLADWSGRRSDRTRGERDDTETQDTPTECAPHASLAAIEAAIREFDDWLERHRFSSDVWPEFDEFVRQVLYTHCGATHTRPYRILSEGDRLLPLRALEATERFELPSARTGVLGHVATTGRSFCVTEVSQGELVRQLAANSPDPPAWCFAVRQGARSIGVISVGQLDDRGPSRAHRRTFELLVSQFWTALGEVCRGRSAITTDVVSGFMTREAFLDEARRAAEASYSRGEPLAVMVIAIEGLRGLLDGGKWDAANDVIHAASDSLRHRVRPDDLLGRFDDARFLVLLRRVDSELAVLIAGQLRERLGQLPVLTQDSPAEVAIRAGVAGSGIGSVPVDQLVFHAVRLCHQARLEQTPILSDLNPLGPRTGRAPPAAERETLAVGCGL